MKVADAIANAMCFRFSPSLYHQQVMELEPEAILVVGQADLAVQEGKLVSSPPSFSCVISQG